MNSQSNNDDYSVSDLKSKVAYLEEELKKSQREIRKYAHKLDRERDHRSHTEVQQESVKFILEKHIKEEKENSARSKRIARQTAHDLNSPLATINKILQRYESVVSPEDFLSMNYAITRGKEVCDGILSEAGFEVASKTTRTTIEKADINSAIQSVIEEITNRDDEFKLRINYTPLDQPVIGNIRRGEITSIISNLIENGMDAVAEKNGDGSIDVSLDLKKEKAVISIKDNGKGMSPDQLAVVGLYGKSFKKHGNGYGVWGAKRTLLTRGGSLKLDSTENIGTTVKIEIPIIKNIQDVLIVDRESDLIVVDDEHIVFGMVKFFTESLKGFTGKVRHFSDARSFERYLESLSREEVLKNRYLVDAYLIPNSPVGIDLIKRNKLLDVAVLYTSDEDLLSLKSASEGFKVRYKSEALSDFISVVS